MKKNVPYTATVSLPAPMAAKVAQDHGAIKPVDHHKKQERRRVRRQEERAWKREAAFAV